jgi:PHD/YefM family antitoxin component YafN of YafNO toxin-antitoxin module
MRRNGDWFRTRSRSARSDFLRISKKIDYLAPMPTMTVSSGDFLKLYGRIVEMALKEPVSITSHGRERLVLLSAEEYRRLKANEQTALYPWELDEASLKALEATEPPVQASAFDHEAAKP